MFTRYECFMRMRPLFDGKDAKTLQLSPTIYVASPSTSGDIAIFTACDSAYFNKYAQAFVASFSTNTTTNPIHIHLYNPDDAAISLANRLSRDWDRFSWSYDTTDLDRLRKADRGIYYCSARFIRMSEFMLRAKQACFCLDVDALCHQNAHDLLELLSKSDIAFHARFHKLGHNTKLLAGTLFVANSRVGLSFISDINSKLSYMIENGFFVDKIDQVVIYACYKRAKKNYKNMIFQHLGGHFIDTAFTDDGVIWYPKGETKNYEKYAQFLRKF